MKIVISTGLSWLRVPVAINLFCKQLQAVNRQPSWSAFTKFKRDYSKYCIMYLTICYKSSSFAQFIQKWTVLSQNFWLYWTFFVKLGKFWLYQSFLEKRAFLAKMVLRNRTHKFLSSKNDLIEHFWRNRTFLKKSGTFD